MLYIHIYTPTYLHIATSRHETQLLLHPTSNETDPQQVYRPFESQYSNSQKDRTGLSRPQKPSKFNEIHTPKDPQKNHRNSSRSKGRLHGQFRFLQPRWAHLTAPSSLWPRHGTPGSGLPMFTHGCPHETWLENPEISSYFDGGLGRENHQ